MITSFSGAHPYRPQCVIEQILSNEPAADRNEVVAYVGAITARIDDGRCARCAGPLPRPPVVPSGSRLTSCRCVPICGPCGTHEGLPMSLLSQEANPDDEDEDGWHLDPVRRDADLAGFRERFRPSAGILSDGMLVTDDGTAPRPIKLRPHPGGWAEHGYDDTSDIAEQQR